MKSNITRSIAIGLCLIGGLSLSYSQNVLWDGNPISIVIKNGEERRIDFPEAIVDLNAADGIHSQSDILLTPEGRLFWKPKTPYEATRVKAVSVTGTLYLLDVSSVLEGGSVETVKIIDPVLGAVATHNAIRPDERPNIAGSSLISKEPRGLPEFLKKNNGNAEPTKKVNNDYVGMARFAFAHFSGPKRLIPKNQAAMVNVGSIPRNWIRVFGSRLQVKPLKSWLMDGHYVTAIYVRNTSTLPLEFDPRALRGEFEFASALNPYLEPKGSLGDEGLWVVISNQPFSDAARAK